MHAILALFLLFPLVGTEERRWDFARSMTDSVLDITSGIQTYSTLTDTTVNMTGRSELHATAANNPVPGCLINLKSPDAWFFLENIRPSLVIANFLGQIQVNGAPAVLNGNVRVVEYVMGTVVIPHSPDYTPLTVFAGSQFTGASVQLGLYTYYRGPDLGGMTQISSFILKRGYMATVAQQADGGGISRVYVAQDGDIAVSALPADLDRAIGFVRVFPWRWTGKKGWAGGPQLLVNPVWSYDWTTDSLTSTPDAVRTRYNYIGRSQYPADPLFAGQLAQVLFADSALTADQVAALVTTPPPSCTPQAVCRSW